MDKNFDTDAYNLARAMKRAETGDGDTYSMKGKSGEFGAYQFMPATWKLYSKKYLGDENSIPTPENQNKVAYAFVADKKKNGYNPAQIASMWNAGEGRPNAYKEGLAGVNKMGVRYDTPAHVAKVSQFYRELSQQKQTGQQVGQAVKPKTTAELRQEKINQGLPVSRNENRVDPTFGGELVRGILKTPARYATNLGNFAEGLMGQEPSQPFSGNYLGEVKAVSSEGTFGERLKDAFGSGLEMASYLPVTRGASLGYQGVKQVLKGQGLKTAAKKFAVPLMKEGAAGGLLGTTGMEMSKSAETGKPISLGNIALGTAAGTVAAPVLGGAFSLGGKALYKGFNAISPTEKFLTTKFDDYIRKIYKGTTGDLNKLDTSMSRVKKGLELLNKESPNISVPDVDAPIGSGITKPFTIKNSTPNEFVSAVLDMGNQIAKKARIAAKSASLMGRKVEINEAKVSIAQAIKKRQISKQTGQRILQELQEAGGDPLKVHDWVEGVNTKYFNKMGDLADKDTARAANEVASILRNNLDKILDRQGYAEAFGNNAELKRMLLIIAKKANKQFNPGDIASDAALDGAISILTANPAYMGRTIASSLFKNLFYHMRRNSGFGALKKAGALAGKMDSGVKMPSTKLKFGTEKGLYLPKPKEGAQQFSPIPLGAPKRTIYEKSTPRGTPFKNDIPLLKAGNKNAIPGETIRLPAKSQSTMDNELISRIKGGKVIPEQKINPNPKEIKYNGGIGTMHGANVYGDFNPEYFYINGKKLSEIKVVPKGVFINVGMNVGQTAEKITPTFAKSKLPKGIRVIGKPALKEIDGEMSWQPQLSRALTKPEMNQYLKDTRQIDIPQFINEGKKDLPIKSILKKNKIEKFDFDHYSTTKGLKELDPAFAGTGAKGTENRYLKYPEFKSKYVNLYHKGAKPEKLVLEAGGNKYSGKVEGKFLKANSDEFKSIGKEAEEYIINNSKYSDGDENAMNAKFLDLVQEKGYNGIVAERGIMYFDKINVGKKKLSLKEKGEIPTTKLSMEKAKASGQEYKWFRGIDEKNAGQGDKFFSTSKDVAGDYGKVSPIKQSELPKNPLKIGSKDELAEIIGYKGDPYTQRGFDDVAKKYAQDKGYDGIIYKSGTFDEPELHRFADDLTSSIKSAEQWLADNMGNQFFYGKQIKPTPEILESLSRYKPTEPVTLYRGIRKGKSDNGKIYESWTYDKNVASEFANGGKIESRVIEPKDIIVDTTKLPKGKLKEMGNMTNESEVIVRTIPKNSIISEAKKFKSAEEFYKHYIGSSTQYNDYTPNLRLGGTEGGVKITELGIDPEKTVTIYRGIDNTTGKIKKVINDGDFVTTDYDSALAYASGKENVVSKKVKAKDLILEDEADFFKEEPFFIGAEYIYSTKYNAPKPLTKSQLTDIWNKANKPQSPSQNKAYQTNVTKNIPKNSNISSIIPQKKSKINLKTNLKTNLKNKQGGFISMDSILKGKSVTTKILKDLEGKTTVSRQYILDATNRGELKQIEREITRDVLSTMKGDTINVKEFANKIEAELLPLKIKDGARQKYYDAMAQNQQRGGGYRYENITLPDELRGNVANYSEHIYESPIKTSAGNTHFPGTKNYFGHTRIEDMADEKDLFNNIGKNNKDYYLAKKVSGKLKSGGTRRVIEIQSDLYQKGNLEREGNLGDHFKSLREKQDYLIDNIKNPSKMEVEANPNYVNDIKKLLKENTKELETYRVKYETKQKELSKLQQYNNPTAHYRLIREEMKQAAIDGKKELLFPTGETAMKIEGLGESDTRSWMMKRANGKFDFISDIPGGLKVGKEIRRFSANANVDESPWIITDVLGDGKFKAVPKKILDDEPFNPFDLTGLSGDDLEIAKAVKETIDRYTETFDISGKIDTSNPIYKFYEKEVSNYLKKFGGERIKDNKGVEWTRIRVKEEWGELPVEAFGKIALSPLNIIAGLTGGAVLGKNLYDKKKKKSLPINLKKKNEQ